MKTKTKIVLSSVLAIVLCLSLIAGATFAMFTDESKVSIAITGGRIDLEAEINASSLKAYSQSYNYEQNKYEEKETGALLSEGKYVAPFTVKSGAQTGGIAEATATQVTLTHMAPLDRVTFDINITNYSDIDAAYRIYVSHEGKLAEALEISYLHTQAGANGGYQILSNSTDWSIIGHTTEEAGVQVETVKVEIIFPDGGTPDVLAREAKAGDNEYQATSCTLTFVVEAYQAYAKLETLAEAPTSTWLVANQTGLNAVAGLCKSGDTIKLQGESWTEEATFETEKALSLKMEGAALSKLNVKAPNAEIEIANAVTTLNIIAIKNGTAKIAGAVTNLALEKGKVEILSTGSVANFSSNPAAETEVTLVIPEGKTVASATAGGAGKTVITGKVTNLTVAQSAQAEHNGTEVTAGHSYVCLADGFYNEGNNYYIFNKAGLSYFASDVNSSESEEAYAGKTITLMENIDFENGAMAPIGSMDCGKKFGGTFDGNHKTVKNATITGTSGVGFIGYIGSGTLKDITLENITCTGVEWVGVLVGYTATGAGTVTNCTIKNCTANGVMRDANDDSANAIGGIIGHVAQGGGTINLTNNTIEGLTITGYRKLGALVGCSQAGNLDAVNIADNTATNVTINQKLGMNGNPKGLAAGATVGRCVGDPTGNDNFITLVNEANPTITDANVTINTTFDLVSADDLMGFAKSVNSGKTYEGQTIKLGADIDLAGKVWIPIGGDTMADHPSIAFSGTFDGQNHTISNLTCFSDVDEYTCAGLFGTITGKIQNVNLENVNVTSTHYAGAVVAYASNCGEVTNCHVIGGTITSTAKLFGAEYDNGDKVGGIAGYGLGVIDSCSVEGLTIQGYRDVGGIAGYIDEGEVQDVTVKNVTLINDRTHNYKNYTKDAEFDVNVIVGEKTADCTMSGSITSENVTKKVIFVDGFTLDGGIYYISNKEGLSYFASSVNSDKNTYAGKTVMLTSDIDLKDVAWTPIGRNGNRFHGTFDGQNHTISNLTSVLDSTSKTQYGNGLFGDITGGAVLKNFTIDNADVHDKVEGKGNVYGIVCGYAYDTVTFENITVKNSKVSAFGKVGAILGMAADPKGTTTIKNCKVENTEIIGAYNCATFAGLTQNEVVLSGNTQSGVEYKYSSRAGAEAYTDLNTTAANGDSVQGKYWKYADNYYMAAWADLYNELKESTISDGAIGIDAIVHN